MSNESAHLSERFLVTFGVGSAVLQLVVFTMVGVMIFDSVLYSVAIGGFAGAGAFFFLPWFLTRSTQGGDEAGLGTANEQGSRSTGAGVFGFGLEIGAITMFVLGFLRREPVLLLGVASGLVVAMGVYLAGSFVFSR